jgi:Fic family protein
MENPNKFRSGRFQTQPGPEPFSFFIPSPLPPANPPLDSSRLQNKVEKAALALGKLDGVSLLLPNHELFLYSYIRKEAVLSSQIEGTQSTISDLILFENDIMPGVPTDDVIEVANYVKAMNYGLQRLTDFPLSLRLIKEIHRVLLDGARGSSKSPGEFRTSQNWVYGSRPGNAKYVPPPPHEILPALDAGEKFLHNNPVETQPLIKAGLAHAQFETIHPFLDGNGRIGRLLITFILCAEKVIDKPLLYLSLYFKQNKQAYYDALQAIRVEGDWERWMCFYLDGVEKTSLQAFDTAKRLITLFEQNDCEIKKLNRQCGTAFRIHDELKKNPIITIPRMAKELKMSFPAIDRATKNLERMGILKEISGKQRDRVYIYGSFLKILNEGAEPEPSM